MATLGRYVPPLALMAVIYALSAQRDLDSGLGTIDTAGRKLIHMAEFGALFLLWRRATGRSALAAAVTLAYAATDEYHQTFVDGRHGTPIDWAIDAGGVAIAATASRVRSR
jgi:VanZ family protein